MIDNNNEVISYDKLVSLIKNIAGVSTISQLDGGEENFCNIEIYLLKESNEPNAFLEVKQIKLTKENYCSYIINSHIDNNNENKNKNNIKRKKVYYLKILITQNINTTLDLSLCSIKSSLEDINRIIITYKKQRISELNNYFRIVLDKTENQDKTSFDYIKDIFLSDSFYIEGNYNLI